MPMTLGSLKSEPLGPKSAKPNLEKQEGGSHSKEPPGTDPRNAPSPALHPPEEPPAPCAVDLGPEENSPPVEDGRERGPTVLDSWGPKSDT